MQKVILWVSILASVWFISYYFFNFSSFCNATDVRSECFQLLMIISRTSLFAPFVLVFSLITYFMPTATFIAWWRFARVAIPVILLISLALNLELHHSAYGDLQNIFDIPILVTLYTVFILGSVWQIVRNRG